MHVSVPASSASSSHGWPLFSGLGAHGSGGFDAHFQVSVAPWTQVQTSPTEIVQKSSLVVQGAPLVGITGKVAQDFAGGHCLVETSHAPLRH
jgi:hypothetical protein